MSNQLVPLGVETCDIFDTECVQEIKMAKIITVIAECFDFMLIKNIHHILINFLYMKVIYLSYREREIYDNVDYICRIFKNETNAALIVNVDLSLEEKNKIESAFKKIIYSHRFFYFHELCAYDEIPDVTFLACSQRITFDIEKNLTHDYFQKKFAPGFFRNICSQNDSTLMIKTNSFKLCNIERSDTYKIYIYETFSCGTILKVIKKIADGKSIFYGKNQQIYDVLWTKYYFLVRCNNIWLWINHFIKRLNLATYSSDIFIIIFQFMIQSFKNHIDGYNYLFTPFYELPI